VFGSLEMLDDGASDVALSQTHHNRDESLTIIADSILSGFLRQQGRMMGSQPGEKIIAERLDLGIRYLPGAVVFGHVTLGSAVVQIIGPALRPRPHDLRQCLQDCPVMTHASSSIPGGMKGDGGQLQRRIVSGGKATIGRKLSEARICEVAPPPGTDPRSPWQRYDADGGALQSASAARSSSPPIRKSLGPLTTSVMK